MPHGSSCRQVSVGSPYSPRDVGETPHPQILTKNTRGKKHWSSNHPMLQLQNRMLHHTTPSYLSLSYTLVIPSPGHHQGFIPMLRRPGSSRHRRPAKVLQIDRFGWDLGKEVDGFLPVPHLQRHVLTQPEGTVGFQHVATWKPTVCDGLWWFRWLQTSGYMPSEATQIF